MIKKAILIIALSGCAFAATRKSDSPEDYYQAGLQDFNNKLWQEAITLFAQLKAKYPYSKYATLAEIRQADVKYGSEHWTEAADAYHAFVQYHPNNEDVPYAMFKEAMSHYQQIDSDIFFLPPNYEKDQGEVARSEQLFSDYLERYSSDKNRGEAEKYLGECRKRLADHELYVARFYRHLNKNIGAAARYEYVRTHFCGAAAGGKGPDLGFDRTVLLELGQTYVKLGDKEKARPVLMTLVEQFPDSSESKSAKSLIASLH